MGCRTKAADAEAFSLELLNLGYIWTGDDRVVITVFRRGDENDIMPLQTGLHHRADIDDGWIPRDERLSRRLSTAEENNFGVQTVFLE